MAIKKSDSSGIPFGNNAGRPANPGTGRLYSNGETQRLELYTSAGSWENIVQEVPGVSSISGTYSELTNSGVITIYGTNFVSGAYATAIGSNGVQINAASTVYNSLVQMTATFTGLSNAQEPYDIKVTNPSNLFGLIPDALYVNASPVWQTNAGSLGTFIEQASISLSATSTDSDSTITYALASGSTLPSGVTLNSANGLISGTLPNITLDTTYTFTINASDGTNTIPRTFSITSTYWDGTSAARPFPTKASMSALASGTYWVKLPGMSAAAETYFDNSNAGGGWLLTFTVTNANGRTVNWYDNDQTLAGATGTPNYFITTNTLGSTATMAKSNAKNEIFNSYTFTETMIVENHNGTVGRKAYGLNATKSYLGWFQDTISHDVFTNRVSSLLTSSGSMSTFTTSELDFNLQLSGAPGDGGRIVPNGPYNECTGGIAARTDGNSSYGSYGWSGNLTRNDGNRAYGTSGITSDHTAWVFVR